MSVLRAEKLSAKHKCLRWGRVAQLLEVQRLPDTGSPGGRAPRSVTIQWNLRSPFAPLKHYFAFMSRDDKYTRPNRERPHAVCSLKNRSEGELNIFFQGFEVNQSVSATLPGFFQPFSLSGFRSEKWLVGGIDRFLKRVLNEQFGKTYGRVLRAAEFVSLLVARAPLLCSGAVGGKRLPS